MPQNKKEEAVFTLITSGIMIFIMGVYNTAIHTGGLEYKTFGFALHSFWLEWLIGFIFAFFIAGKLAKYLAFKIVIPEDRAIFKILAIQTFTVCIMVPLMSMVGTVEASGININLPVIWLQTICINFVMAYPLQIFIVGPLCRKIFRGLFRKQAL